MFGQRLASMSRPHTGAYPVIALPRADKPDSRLVCSPVHELEKQTALLSAHAAQPSSSCNSVS